MKKSVLAASAAIALALGISAPASALTWVTQMNYTDAGGETPVTSKGTVTAVDQGDGKTVRITVALDASQALDRIIDTGAHWAFTWNLDDPDADVTLITTGGTRPFVYQDPDDGAFTQTGAFGNFTNAFACCGPGANNGKTSLVFDVYRAGGLTFAGVGATQNGDGSINYGTGSRFKSNTSGSLLNGGWWFAMDIFDAPGGTGPGSTYVIAGRDAVCQGDACAAQPPPPPGGIPEPGTWALMIVGFGGAGAMLRRRRALPA
ncbi:MAG: PEPxxWA-CTERM sorting domain-containing protein [Phenylobacterium sp.]|uniref:PEPxxWA-CTERM sorting domain-containing protein n=1 Tax=Phenylobacterium sp. TaxID=1871053 RepID=UPI001A3AAF99|nr:PEPxxWA-CTERM sorting domain-containing protein [Phenylobacterium sp.]MBL8554714.1 PEPxxWA-CTERM sorting domain-containing protein [Phenylobacterium sp.]